MDLTKFKEQAKTVKSNRKNTKNPHIGKLVVARINEENQILTGTKEVNDENSSATEHQTQENYLKKKDSAEKAHKKLDVTEKKMKPLNKEVERRKKKEEKEARKRAEEAARAEAKEIAEEEKRKEEEERARAAALAEAEEKKNNAGRKPIDKTPTWTRYYAMRRIPRSILDILKDRLTYDKNLEAFTATIKGTELFDELKDQYPNITNTTINTSFYRLKEAGWFKSVTSYSGPDSDRTVGMDPSLVMTPNELRILKQDH